MAFQTGSVAALGHVLGQVSTPVSEAGTLPQLLLQWEDEMGVSVSVTPVVHHYLLGLLHTDAVVSFSKSVPWVFLLSSGYELIVPLLEGLSVNFTMLQLGPQT